MFSFESGVYNFPLAKEVLLWYYTISKCSYSHKIQISKYFKYSYRYEELPQDPLPQIFLNSLETAAKLRIMVEFNLLKNKLFKFVLNIYGFKIKHILKLELKLLRP